MMPAGTQPTLSRDDAACESATGRGPELIIVLVCDHPTAGSSRHALGELDEVEIGRAAKNAAARSARQLTIGVDDARMSKLHARLVRDLSRWVVEDAGSKNGVRVNGVPQQRALLEDGDILELGHTMCLFRAAVDTRRPLDCYGDQLAMPAAGLATFVPALASAFDDLAAIACTDAPILVLGETGTGKELVARAVHALARRTGAFIAVNCGALPESLAASELFGYTKGAFSGANQDRQGLVRSAHRGTLFLDEVGDLAPALQTTLLRVLQEREVCPVGSSQSFPVDLSVVAATHHDLEQQVAAGRFRRDLYARLAAFTLRLPPLRARIEDLGLLVADLLARAQCSLAGPARFSPEAAYALLQHDWPSNIRELAACLVVTPALARGDTIRLEHLPPALRGSAGCDYSGEPSVVDDPKRAELVALLKQYNGNVSAVARAANRSRVQVHRWLRQLELDAARYRH